MSGQHAELFPLLRASLEYAGCALHLYLHPHTEETLWRRHDSEKTLKATRKEFVVARVVDSVRSLDPREADVFETLYQTAIDFGGHPNERAISSSLIIEDQKDLRRLQVKYLHDDGHQLKHGLRTTAQVGVCALSVGQLAFTERFKQVGADVELARLKVGL